MSTTGSFFQQLRKQIARDELASVLQQLRILLNNSPRVREIIKQQERFAEIRQRIRLGKVDYTEADLTQTRIAQGLLNLINELEQRSKNPTLGAELAQAVTITNSKNLNTGTATAGRDQQFGDRTETHYHYYGERDLNIPHALTVDPFRAEVFLGRVRELEDMHRILFEENNLLLLVNGNGGVGKTTVAARYYREHGHKYQHKAWVLSEQSIGRALLQLGTPLQVPFGETMTEEQRLDLLFHYFANLNGPCLLIIDNANEQKDLADHYQRLRSLDDFHVLLTSRIRNFQRIAEYPIEGLPEDQALKLFEEYYQRFDPATEKDTFLQIRAAVNNNTLVVELLAKNLARLNKLRSRYTLNDLLSDLQSKGVLQLSQQAAVSTDYQSRGRMREESPEAIIAAMYELGDLPPEEVALLSVFAVLPAEQIPLTALDRLLSKKMELDEPLLNLTQKGWLEHNEDENNFKCSPVIQEIVRRKNKNLLEDCRPLIKALIGELHPDVLHLENYLHSSSFVVYAEAVVEAIEIADDDLATLCQNIGNFFSDTGHISKTMTAYETMADLQAKLLEEEPENAHFKNGLAISYEKLGETHAALGNLQRALQFYQDETTLFVELHEAFPNNVNFKNGLAISYEKLGSTHAALGNLQRALQFYEQYNTLEQELHEAFPNNVNFKNGLAISYSKLGETHAALGNLQRALQFYQDETTLFVELHEAFPNNVNFKNGLAISYSKLGETHAALGNLQRALQFYQDRSRIGKELHEAFPNNVNFKNGLAISYEKLGSTHAALGNLQRALQFYEQYNTLEQELHEAFPNNVNFKNGLAISYYKLGQTYTSLERPNEALPYFEKDLQLTKELFEDFSDNVGFKNNLGISYAGMGLFYRDQLKDATSARTCFAQSLAIRQELAEQFPGYPEFQQNLEKTQNALAALEDKT